MARPPTVDGRLPTYRALRAAAFRPYPHPPSLALSCWLPSMSKNLTALPSGPDIIAALSSLSMRQPASGSRASTSNHRAFFTFQPLAAVSDAKTLLRSMVNGPRPHGCADSNVSIAEASRHSTTTPTAPPPCRARPRAFPPLRCFSPLLASPAFFSPSCFPPHAPLRPDHHAP